MNKPRFHNGKIGVAIKVRVIPRSSKSGIQQILEDGTIKIRLNSAPIDGKANQELINYLAEIFSISKGRIEIIAGHKNKDKLVSILDIDSESASRIIRSIPGLSAN